MISKASRWLLVFSLLSAPAVALAASGESAASDRAMQFALLAINSWIASRIGPLEKRVGALEAKR